MKKFFAKLIIFLSVFLGSLVAVPFTSFHWWADTYSWLSWLPASALTQGNNELWIKAGIGGFAILVSLVFLILSLVENSREGKVQRSTAGAVVYPPVLFGLFGLIFAGALAAFTYQGDPSTTNLVILAALAVVALNYLFGVHLLVKVFRRENNFTRIMLYVFLLEMAGVGGGAAYYIYSTFINYAGRYTLVHMAIVAGALVLYIAHGVILGIKGKKQDENETLEREVEQMENVPSPEMKEPTAPDIPLNAKPEPRPESKPLPQIVAEPVKTVKLTKAQKQQKAKEEALAAKGKKSTIVSKEQTILSDEQNVDPTALLFEEVVVDPEFSKTTNMDKQVSSIEYYIEKPKMFKPLDPTFDSLVAHVREFPNVVTKISDERITFYVDRKAFLVLMNFGNYYRMAFRADLEKGVRLIIKYPTISKNKGTKDALWFKANNYGDLPKEIIFEIVKSAFDNVNA